MQSGKQKRAAIMQRRQRRSEHRRGILQTARAPRLPMDRLAVDAEALRLMEVCSAPMFAVRGYYSAVAFRCRDCGIEQIWTAQSQKWWYEEAHGHLYSTAVRCRACRQSKRLAPHQRRDQRTVAAVQVYKVLGMSAKWRAAGKR